MLTSLGLSDPTSQWGLLPGGVRAPVLPQAARPGERSSALMESSPLAWVRNRAPVCCLSVSISLRVTGHMVPTLFLTGKSPQLCLGCSALGSPGSNHRVRVGLRGSLHDVPPCPAACPAQLPIHLARGARAWPSCCTGSRTGPYLPEPQLSGTAEPDDF